MAGYPRVIGGYVAGGHYYPGFGVGASAPQQIADQMSLAAHAAIQAAQAAGMTATGVAPSYATSPPWRPMAAPGSPPLGEGHVPMPLNPEAFNGTWGAGGAAAGVTITFSARPQKPFKATRLLITGTKSGPTAIGRLVGQTFVGTDLQQGELGNIDLESLGAGGSFDTWISFKQAEPGVWIRVQGTLTAFPVAPDFEVYTITCIGHYLH
jgi:hypothetical protein